MISPRIVFLTIILFLLAPPLRILELLSSAGLSAFCQASAQPDRCPILFTYLNSTPPSRPKELALPCTAMYRCFSIRKALSLHMCLQFSVNLICLVLHGSWCTHNLSHRCFPKECLICLQWIEQQDGPDR